MGYTPQHVNPDSAHYALRTFRRALTARLYKAVDILLLGDSLTEGYYTSQDSKRWSNLFRQQMQKTFNPQGVPGGEGYVPATHTLGAHLNATAAPGSVNLPQRWNWASGVLTNTEPFGFGLGRRYGYLSSQLHWGTTTFYGDRAWLHYTLGAGVGYFVVAVDGKMATISTIGALSGTGTGTFVVSDPENWPPGSFTLTVQDEDMTVTQGTGTSNSVFTITARGINGTTAVAHNAVGIPVMWAPAGVQRVSTYNAAPPRASGRFWDTGVLTRGNHTLAVAPISKTTGGAPAVYNVVIEGVTVFDGDGSTGQATFMDGATISSTVAAGSNGVNVNTFVGAQTLNVASTTNFPSATAGAPSKVAVQVGSGWAIIRYTGSTGTTLTGCTTEAATVSTVAAGTLATGGLVVSQHYDSATAKFVALDAGNQFRAPNLLGGNIVIQSVTSGTRVKLSVPPQGIGTGQMFSLGGRGAGIRVWESGHAGYTTSSFAGPSETAAGYWAGTLDVVDPDLVLITLGINDFSLGVPAATVRTNLVSIVNLINSKSNYPPSIVFGITWLPSTGTLANYQPHIDAIYEAAAQVGGTVFDMNAIIPQQVAGDTLSDGLHPTDLGSSIIALELVKFLTGADKTELPAPVTFDWSMAMKTWRQAVSMASIRPVDVAFLGDSITEGYYASTDSTRYVDLIRKRLQQLYNPPTVQGGEGYVPMVHTVGALLTASPPTGFTNLPQRWTFANPPEALGSMTSQWTNGFGWGRRAWYYSSGTTSTATTTVYCDRFWVLYTAFTLGSVMEVRIDGNLQTSQPSTASSIIQSGRVWDSGPLTLGNHTIQLNSNTAGGGAGVIFDGIMVFCGDGGDISFTDGQTFTNNRLVSYTGYFTRRDVGKTITGTPFPANTQVTKIISVSEVELSQNTLSTGTGVTFTIGGRGSGVRVWDGGQAAATTAYFASETLGGYWNDALETIDPDLVFVQLGPNDANASAPSAWLDQATFQANLVTIVNKIRMKSPSNPTIVFVASWVSGVTTLQNWQPYRDAMYQVATNMGCAVIDMGARMGPGPASGATELFSDALHLTDPGQVVSANEHLIGLGLDERDARVAFYQPGQPNNPAVGQLWIDSDEASATYDDLAYFGADGTLTVRTGTSRFRFPFAATILGVTAAVGTAPTGAALIMDVNKNGTSIFATNTGNRPTIAVSTFATTTEPTPDTTAMAAGDYLTVDIDQIGSTVAGSDLTVFVRYRRA